MTRREGTHICQAWITHRHIAIRDGLPRAPRICAGAAAGVGAAVIRAHGGGWRGKRHLPRAIRCALVIRCI
ncbi:MAG: hypothetical protein Q4G22_03305 [Paracoccus sp. (in: a-proteobacteria)]|uniref:hypothetical protein n=1 Tax=Paracoccus sp. TaxID=267 RepID=UPI0026DF19C0|nr:hypothetical protein [Paracoccus sp. (in: a-proteobacteria)]MDO5630845.1 hypothetical protein [Paracoccus sp. (in: a-proteobacteria)]